ncbi:MAG: twin-arginine translocase subunit TatC [Chitinispirillia bacterium]|nr:twin-arginine translocase subunit TatC [Chitinispirillia bacterium]
MTKSSAESFPPEESYSGGGSNTPADLLESGYKKMTLTDHLEELRSVLIRCGFAVVLCAVPCGIFWKRIFELLTAYPLKLSDPLPTMIYTTPAEAIMLSIKIALVGGLLFASPFIFLQMWKFIAPGLYKNEKRVIIPAAFASTICFLAGVTFSSFLLPMMLRFLTGFGAGLLDPFFKAGEYLGFIMRICLAFGVAFQLPVVAFVLAKMGVINHLFLLRYARHAIVGIFILAAILTPPDVLSQVLLALPLLVLYALSIFISFICGKKA